MEQTLQVNSRVENILQQLQTNGQARDRLSLVQVWQAAEALLEEDDYGGFELRPFALERDRGVFREDVKVRRVGGPTMDKWQPSGGVKGSTVWPMDDAEPRIRCQYGRIVRDDQKAARFQLYTFIRPEGKGRGTLKDMERSTRRLFVVSPAEGKRQPQQIAKKISAKHRELIDSHTSLEGTGGNYEPSTTLPLSVDDGPVVGEDAILCKEIDRLLSGIYQQATQSAGLGSQVQGTVLDAVYELLELVRGRLHPLPAYQRPNILGQLPLQQHIFLEAGKTRRRVDKFDRWVNSGGKRAVRELQTTDGRSFQMRAGRIHRYYSDPDDPDTIDDPDDPDGLPLGDQGDLRYQQYSIASSDKQFRRVRETATLYVVYVKHTKPKPSAVAASAKRSVDPSNEHFHSSGRPKRLRGAWSPGAAAMQGSLVVIVGLVVVLTLTVLATLQGAGSSGSSGASSQSQDAAAAAAAAAAAGGVSRPGRWQHVDNIEVTTAGSSPASGILAHPPQFAATWQSAADDTLYAFGGSGSTWTDEITRTSVSRKGAECYASAIGITDELWQLDRAGGPGNGPGVWSLVSGGLSNGGNISSGQQAPLGRAGAASWTLSSSSTGGIGMIFGGVSDLCIATRGDTPSGPPDEYVISGCADPAHCGTFVRSNWTCDHTPVYQNAESGNALFRTNEGGGDLLSKWIVGPSPHAADHRCDSPSDVRNNYLESQYIPRTAPSSDDPSTAADAYLIDDWTSEAIVWYEATDPDHPLNWVTIMGSPDSKFRIVARYNSDDQSTGTTPKSKQQQKQQQQQQQQEQGHDSGTEETETTSTRRRRPPVLQPKFADGAGFYLPPTSLYLYSAQDASSSSSGGSSWTLLGGTDSWTQLTSSDAATAISDGFLRTAASVWYEAAEVYETPTLHTYLNTYLQAGSGLMLWPLPRSRSQTFSLGDSSYYMFSGRFKMVQVNLGRDHETNPAGMTEDRLMNDLWVFSRPGQLVGSDISASSSSSAALAPAIATRVASCGRNVDRIDLLPSPYGSTMYPGPRQDAATWSVPTAGGAAAGGGGAAPAPEPCPEPPCQQPPPTEAQGQGWMFGGMGCISTEIPDTYAERVTRAAVQQTVSVPPCPFTIGAFPTGACSSSRSRMEV
jgi:hypothetical protein